MSAIPLTTATTAASWTCPFCALLCDHLGVQMQAGARPGNEQLALTGGACAKAQSALLQFSPTPSAVQQPLVDGRAVSAQDAIHAAAQVLQKSQQPLISGLGTDVAGARALYRLACQTGAICDPGDGAQGPALMHVLTALQDRGTFTTTLAEVRARADVIVFVGAVPLAQAPLLLTRLGLTQTSATARQVLLLAPNPGDEQLLRQNGLHASVAVNGLVLAGDLFDQLAALAMPAPQAPAVLATLRAAHYCVFIGATAALPAQGALVVEAVNHLVGQLNQSTRAAALWIASHAAASTVNQVFTWLSGLPLRSRAGPAGLEHEPLTFDTTRLLQDSAVDSLLWVSSWHAHHAPPATPLPLLVLGHAALAASCQRPGTVFIPVATPGVHSAGHLFRADGSVMLPLFAAFDAGLPGVADVVDAITHQLRLA